MNIIIFLIVLAVLILVHEFGHFIVAKKSGVRVDEFGLGFPPKLFGVKKGETEYTVNAIPFGGFVKIFGENPDDESLHGPDRERSLVYKPKWIQAVIISAGVLFNFLLAWILFSLGFMYGLPMSSESYPRGATVVHEELIITDVKEGAPAERGGILKGDVVRSLMVSGEVLEVARSESMKEFIVRHGEETITLTYTRDGKESVTKVTPEKGVIGDMPGIGVALQTLGIVQLPTLRAFFEGGKMTVVLTGATIAAFADLVKDAFQGEADLKSLAGPVGIVSLVGDATALGFVYLLQFVAFISINLGVLNLLPIPALDGGRLLFLLIEAVKGSRMNYKIVNMIHAVSFVFLVLLMLLVTYNDIVRLVGN